MVNSVFARAITQVCSVYAPCPRRDKEPERKRYKKREGETRYHNSIKLLSYKCKSSKCAKFCCFDRTDKVYAPNSLCLAEVESIKLPQRQAQQRSQGLHRHFCPSIRPLLSLLVHACVWLLPCAAVCERHLIVCISMWFYVCMHDGMSVSQKN